MVQHGLTEGVKNMYKTSVILPNLKMKSMPGAATQTIPKNKISKTNLKIKVSRDRLRALWLPLGVVLFLVCTKWVLRWSSTKVQQHVKINGLERFQGTHFGGPISAKSVPMQRGARFQVFRSVPMQLGARSSLCDMHKS